MVPVPINLSPSKDCRRMADGVGKSFNDAVRAFSMDALTAVEEGSIWGGNGLFRLNSGLIRDRFKKIILIFKPLFGVLIEDQNRNLTG